jgi:16S rRNA (uracil1498-N3)-methyltransferase
MSICRIFQPVDLLSGARLQLDSRANQHVAVVLRAKLNDHLTLFNGQGGEYRSVIVQIKQKQVTVQVEKYSAREAESPLELYLAQGIARGDKMDYIIQKAVELGVKKIIPLLTERCTVKLDGERRAKRLQHWQSIIISACEQSGRNRIPELFLPIKFKDIFSALEADWSFVLVPTTSGKLKEKSIQENQRVSLLIGPEGGLSDAEIQQACQQKFLPLNLGPRILRTETAAVAALAVLQSSVGDMG